MFSVRQRAQNSPAHVRAPATVVGTKDTMNEPELDPTANTAERMADRPRVDSPELDPTTLSVDDTGPEVGESRAIDDV